MYMKTKGRATECPTKIRAKVPGRTDFCRKKRLADGISALESQSMRDPRFTFGQPPAPAKTRCPDALHWVAGPAAEKLAAPVFSPANAAIKGGAAVSALCLRNSTINLTNITTWRHSNRQINNDGGSGVVSLAPTEIQMLIHQGRPTYLFSTHLSRSNDQSNGLEVADFSGSKGGFIFQLLPKGVRR